MGPQIFGAAGSSGSGGGGGAAWDNQEPIIYKKDLEILTYETGGEISYAEVYLTASQLRKTVSLFNTGEGVVGDTGEGGSSSFEIFLPNKNSIAAEFPDVQVGDSFIFEINHNSFNGTARISSGGGGVYIFGDQVLKSRDSATFRIFRRSNVLEFWDNPEESWIAVRIS